MRLSSRNPHDRCHIYAILASSRSRRMSSGTSCMDHVKIGQVSVSYKCWNTMITLVCILFIRFRTAIVGAKPHLVPSPGSPLTLRPGGPHIATSTISWLNSSYSCSFLQRSHPKHILLLTVPEPSASRSGTMPRATYAQPSIISTQNMYKTSVLHVLWSFHF